MRTYTPESRELQDRFDTRRLADRIESLLVRPHLSEGDAAFISARDMFFLATADADGQPSCSYKGGDPGFVRVLDPGWLAFPNYDGNGMFISLGNAMANPRVGLLFIDFESPSRLRVEGRAQVDPEDPLLPEWPEAQLVVRVAVERVFPNCPRYIHRYRREESSAFVPHAGEPTPVPDWKRSDWAADALPEGDPARRSE